MIDLSTMHALLMIVAWAMLLMAFLIARFMKQRVWWLKAHRAMAVLGASVVMLGMLAAVLDISITNREHFAVHHAYVGFAAVLLAALTPTLGYLQLKIRSAAARIRIFHRWSGRATLAIMLVNIFLGLSYVGLI